MQPANLRLSHGMFSLGVSLDTNLPLACLMETPYHWTKDHPSPIHFHPYYISETLLPNKDTFMVPEVRT